MTIKSLHNIISSKIIPCLRLASLLYCGIVILLYFGTVYSRIRSVTMQSNDLSVTAFLEGAVHTKVYVVNILETL